MYSLARCISVVVLSLTSALAQQPIYHATTQPIQDPILATLPGETMLSIPGLFTDFVIAGGGQFVELVAIDVHLAGRGDESNWVEGWIRVIDNQRLEVHPRPGLAPGTSTCARSTQQ